MDPSDCAVAPLTGNPTIDMVLKVLGGIYVISSAVGNAFPNGNRFGTFLRKVSLSLRPEGKHDDDKPEGE